MAQEELVIGQVSDVHFGDARFDAGLAQSVVDEVNGVAPDLLIVAGDLTESGYREQFEGAAEWLQKFECGNRLVVPGNHDVRNVGYIHFAEMFGARFSAQTLELGGQAVRLIGVDTSKPDLNQGELGRARHLWLFDECAKPADVKIVVLHHHLVSVPGTGRERNILWDAGDILEILSETGVDLVMCGHKHVPYVWEVGGITISTSGTAITRRTRGKTPPSFSLLRVLPDKIAVTMRNTGEETGRTAVVERRRLAPPVARPTRGRQAAEAGSASESSG